MRDGLDGMASQSPKKQTSASPLKLKLADYNAADGMNGRFGDGQFDVCPNSNGRFGPIATVIPPEFRAR